MGLAHGKANEEDQPKEDQPNSDSEDTVDGFTEIETTKSEEQLNLESFEKGCVIPARTAIPPEGVYFNAVTELLLSTESPPTTHQTAIDKPEAPKSAHESYVVVDKNNIKYRLKIYEQGKDGDYAHQMGQRALAQLEAIAAAYCQLLSTSYKQIPFSTSVCYDDNNDVKGVLSELFADWIPYKNERLNDDDLTIHLIYTQKEEKLQTNLTSKIHEYINANLNRDYKNETESQKSSPYSYLGSLYGAATKAATLVKNTATYYVSSTASAIQLNLRLKDYLIHKDQFSPQELEKLLKELEDRKKHIEPFLQDIHRNEHDRKRYQDETASLEAIFSTIHELQLLYKAKSFETLTSDDIEKLEALDEVASKQAIDLDKRNDNERLYNLLPDSDISIDVKSLKNYRIIKGLAVVLAVRYIYEDDDAHANNISKKGKQIDFDRFFIYFLTRFPKLYALKQNNPLQIALEKLFGIRQPIKETFAITGDVVKNFPMPPKQKPSHPFYSPAYGVTGQPVISTVGSESASKNFYTPKDHEIFEKLSKHPAFQFHARKTFLKYLVIPYSFYEPFFDLHMDNDGEIKDLRDTLLAYEKEKIEESRKALLTDPDFKCFINKQGYFAAKLIEAEILEFKTMLLGRYGAKLKDLEDKALTCEEKDRDIATEAKTKLESIINDIATTINPEIIRAEFDGIKRTTQPSSPSAGWMSMVPIPPIEEIEADLFFSGSPPGSPTMWKKRPTVPISSEIKKIEGELFSSKSRSVQHGS